MGGACYAANRGFAVRRNKLVAGGKPLFLSTLIAEKNMLKKLIMLAALALPCQLALAFENTIPLGSLSSPSFAPVTSSYGASFAGQSFTDHFTFSITPASVFNSFVATFDYPGVFGLTSFSTSLYTGGGTFVAGGGGGGGPPRPPPPPLSRRSPSRPSVRAVTISVSTAPLKPLAEATLEASPSLPSPNPKPTR